MLSIGGWTYSPKFHPVVTSSAARKEFVRSSVKLLEDYGLDGIDVDYEVCRPSPCSLMGVRIDRPGHLPHDFE